MTPETRRLRSANRFARWELKLDRRLRFRIEESSTFRYSTVVYVGFWEGGEPAWFIPSSIQPATVTAHYPGEDGVMATVTVKLRPGLPISFDRVTPAPE
jgi:hypothetical protein